jgi:hypothetical protein
VVLGTGSDYPEPRIEHPTPRLFSSNDPIFALQLTKYQYTILDLLQERIIFLHLEDINL